MNSISGAGAVPPSAEFTPSMSGGQSNGFCHRSDFTDADPTKTAWNGFSADSVKSHIRLSDGIAVEDRERRWTRVAARRCSSFPMFKSAQTLQKTIATLILGDCRWGLRVGSGASRQPKWICRGSLRLCGRVNVASAGSSASRTVAHSCSAWMAVSSASKSAPMK